MTYGLTAAVLAWALAAPAHAQVHVDIGIHFPAPPQLVVVREVQAVQYVPAARANMFFYGHQYWVFANGGWHVSRGHDGPWIVVAPHSVPQPVLLVPVQYYHVPPGHWKTWGKHQPPRWHSEYGREWADKRGWKHRDRDDDDHGKHRDARGKSRGRGHGKDK